MKYHHSTVLSPFYLPPAGGLTSPRGELGRTELLTARPVTV